MKNQLITVFGGSGFIGRHLVKHLMDQGATVRVAVRDVEQALFLKPLGNAGQVVPFPTNITNMDSVKRAVAGADGVVNLVGILFERGKSTFERIHVEGSRNIAAAASDAGIKKMVQVSAMGADEASSAVYAKTKARAEKAVLELIPGAVILRPSVVFGPEDNFFNQFAALAKYLPFLPVMGAPVLPKVKLFDGTSLISVDLFGDGGPKFQPVHVEDVAHAVIKGLSDPELAGKTFELGGPQVYSFKEIMELVLENTGHKCALMPVPLGLAQFQSWFLQMLPTPILTPDQVKLLGRDNVVPDGSLGFADLGITPASAEAILPTYLHRFKQTGKRRIHA